MTLAGLQEVTAKCVIASASGRIGANESTPLKPAKGDADMQNAPQKQLEA
jgi:hypothetical protein